MTEALIERECSIQVRKWRESRGELTHQPVRRLHGTRAIYEYKRRAGAISSGGSFSFLGSPVPPPGPLRASSSLLSLPGFRKSKAPLYPQAKKGSFSGPSAMEGPPHQSPPGTTSSAGRGLSHKPPIPPAASQRPPAPQSPLVGNSAGSSQSPVKPSEATSAEGQPAASATAPPPPPSTLSPAPKIVSEQITPTIPSPTANNAPLAPCPDAKKDVAREAEAPTGEEEAKKKRKSKDDKKKDKEDEKRKVREKKEKEKAEKERLRKEKERLEKEKKKGGKKRDKGAGEAEDKNGAAATKDVA